MELEKDIKEENGVKWPKYLRLYQIMFKHSVTEEKILNFLQTFK